MARTINYDHTSMRAQCLDCTVFWRASQGTGCEDHDVANLRRRVGAHAKRTGHTIRFQEKRVMEGRIGKRQENENE